MDNIDSNSILALAGYAATRYARSMVSRSIRRILRKIENVIIIYIAIIIGYYLFNFLK